MAVATVISQGARGRGHEVVIQPVVDRLPRDAQLGGDGGDRMPPIELQESQATAEYAHIVGGVAGPSQPQPLLGSEVQHHGIPSGRGHGPKRRIPFHSNSLICSRRGPKTPGKQGPTQDNRPLTAEARRPNRLPIAQTLFQ